MFRLILSHFKGCDIQLYLYPHLWASSLLLLNFEPPYQMAPYPSSVSAKQYLMLILARCLFAVFGLRITLYKLITRAVTSITITTECLSELSFPVSIFSLFEAFLYPFQRYLFKMVSDNLLTTRHAKKFLWSLFSCIFIQRPAKTPAIGAQYLSGCYVIRPIKLLVQQRITLYVELIKAIISANLK